MKNQKGITLVSLSIYVIGITIIVGIVATVTSFFYSNTQSINDSASSIGEFNKFNLEMIRETKLDGNTVTRITDDQHRIVFSSGTVFTFANNGIYKNKVKICSNVTNCIFNKSMQEEKEVITTLFEMDNFAKTMEYVINNKVVADSNMEKNYTQIYSKQYIQNGLMLHYDAINNTGEGHSDDTTTWVDLSGNGNDGIMHNVLWGDNGAVFNGENSWVNCGELNSDYQTITGTFSVNRVTGNWQCIIGNWQNGGGGIAIDTNGTTFGGEYYINGYKDNYQTNIEIGKTYYGAITYNGDEMVIYLNGNRIYGITTSGVIGQPQNNVVMALGTNPEPVHSNNNQFFDGKIYSAKVYNRALTAEEIRQNYEIEKEKYGIID